jgi:hypothetical protein
VLLPSGTHYFPTDRDVVTKVVGAINQFVDGRGKSSVREADDRIKPRA